MLKYRIEFTASRRRYIYLLFLYALLILSLFSWQQDIFPYQRWLQVMSAVLLLLLAVQALCKAHRHNRAFTVLVSEQGEWLYVQRAEQSSWQLSRRSRISSEVLWLYIEPKIAGSKPHWLWLFNDQMNEQDYRRLCRCILYQQVQGKLS